VKPNLKSRFVFGLDLNRKAQPLVSALLSGFFVFFLLALNVSCASRLLPDPTAAFVPPTLTFLPPTLTAALPSATATQLPPTATLAPPPSICSPLAVQPIDKLGEIITQPFKMPSILVDGTYKEEDATHHGVDLGYYTRDKIPFTGTPVLAAFDGKIAAVIHNRPPYGDMVILETPLPQIPTKVLAKQVIPEENSLYTLYAHLQKLQPLEIGQSIQCGEQLAETGLTGFTGGPHLHFETRWGPAGQTFASMAYYQADITAEERANYQKWRMSGVFQLFDPMVLFK